MPRLRPLKVTEHARIPEGRKAMIVDRDDLAQRVTAMERTVTELYCKCQIEAFATRLCVFPNAPEADEWRAKLEKARERLSKALP
jgi:hypothetical protein